MRLDLLSLCKPSAGQSGVNILPPRIRLRLLEGEIGSVTGDGRDGYGQDGVGLDLLCSVVGWG